MGKRRGAHRVFVRRPDGKRAIGRCRRRWQNNIKMDFKKWDGEAWTAIYHSADFHGIALNNVVNIPV
jgi:hypothetical protein